MLYGRNQQNTVKQLSSNFKKSYKKETVTEDYKQHKKKPKITYHQNIKKIIQ